MRAYLIGFWAHMIPLLRANEFLSGHGHQSLSRQWKNKKSNGLLSSCGNRGCQWSTVGLADRSQLQLQFWHIFRNRDGQPRLGGSGVFIFWSKLLCGCAPAGADGIRSFPPSVAVDTSSRRVLECRGDSLTLT